MAHPTKQYAAPNPGTVNGLAPWSAGAKFVFRVFFIYFFIQVVPLDWKFYRDLFSIQWSDLQFSDIFAIAHYTPRFRGETSTYADWGILFLLAIAGAVVWTYAERNKQASYNQLYYWLRVIVRYRLAIAVIAYGFIKFFPIQAPYPSLSHLNTNYGDFTRWKLFSLSLGIVPGYESFLGTVEIVAGVLLLYRRTASVGAFIVIIFTGNVFVSNLAYEGGEQVYSLYLITLALFVLSYDAERLANLLVFQRPAAPVLYKPVFTTKTKQYIRVAIKSAFILFFILLYGWQTGAAYKKASVRYPDQKGLAGASGLYNVQTFVLNKDSLPYAPNDPVRWQDVVFEDWNTISVRSNRPVAIDSNNIEHFAATPIAKAYEMEGVAARQYYSYTVDTIQQQLLLVNRNEHEPNDRWLLHYERVGDSAIVLSGINDRKDSLSVVLNRLNKKYLLEEVAKRGRQKPIRL